MFLFNNMKHLEKIAKQISEELFEDLTNRVEDLDICSKECIKEWTSIVLEILEDEFKEI